MTAPVAAYLDAFAERLRGAAATDAQGAALPLDAAIAHGRRTGAEVKAQGAKAMIVGNGGSAAIASHFATDWTKNGKLTTQCFTDGSALTCFANDYGYEDVFAKAIEFYGRPGDWLIAISSSGTSKNILKAVAAARALDLPVLTLSGFKPENPLRQAGDMNLHVASGVYGFVELAHMTLLHAMLDLAMGWDPENPDAQPWDPWSAGV